MKKLILFFTIVLFSTILKSQTSDIIYEDNNTINNYCIINMISWCSSLRAAPLRPANRDY